MRNFTLTNLLWILSIINFVLGSRLQSSRPHVIFILADDLGWNDVSFHGSNQIPTPNIDSLAKRGIILNNYYVAPICTPSRSSLMTAKYDIHTGMQHDVIYGSQPYGLTLSEKLLPQYLKDLGYDTHIVGKWHLGFFKTEYTPTHRGFDTHFGYFCSHQDYYDHTAQETPLDWGFDMRNGSKIVKETHGSYTTNLFTKEAMRLIYNHNSSKPMFLYLAHLAAHAGNWYAPLQAPREYINRFPNIKDERRKTLAGMIAGLDASVGEVIMALHEKSMLQNSIVIFSTDNGGPTNGMGYNFASNWPLKGSKFTLWEGGVRGNSFIWCPQFHRTPRVSYQLMHITDWLPTLYTAAGGKVSDLPSTIDGIDMWEALKFNLTSPRKEILHNIDDIYKIAALRVGDYKVVIGHTLNGEYDNWFPPVGMDENQEPSTIDRLCQIDEILDKYHQRHDVENVPQDARVVCGPVPENAIKECQPQISPCLFDIQKDPCEFHNLANSHKDVLQKLLDRLHEFNKTSIPPANKPDDPNGNPKFHGYTWVPWLDETN